MARVDLEELERRIRSDHNARLTRAQSIALLEIASAALAFVATQGDRCETEWADLKLALAPVNP